MCSACVRVVCGCVCDNAVGVVVHEASFVFEAEYHVSKVFALCLHLGDFGFVLLVRLLHVLAHGLAYIAVATLLQNVLADAGIDAAIAVGVCFL